MIKDELIKLSDIKYKNFSKKLIPGDIYVYGVRLPILRKISKNIKLEELSNNSLEELLLQGFIIAEIKDLKKLFIEMDRFIPLINNWSVCDSFVSSLKITKEYKLEMFNYITKYITSDNEFERRFVIVMIIFYYIKDEYIDDIKKIISNINTDGYYVKMAISWLISEIFYYNYDIGIYLINNIKDSFIRKKSISKIKESNKKDKIDLNLYLDKKVVN